MPKWNLTRRWFLFVKKGSRVGSFIVAEWVPNLRQTIMSLDTRPVIYHPVKVALWVAECVANIKMWDFISKSLSVYDPGPSAPAPAVTLHPGHPGSKRLRLSQVIGTSCGAFKGSRVHLRHLRVGPGRGRPREAPHQHPRNSVMEVNGVQSTIFKKQN